jgi:anti-sigma B factor antagonist
MAGVDLSTRESDGQVVVTLRGQLDLAEAARVAAALAAVAAREPQIIVDLAALEFIDSSGVAALVRGRNLARRAGGELLLAAPQQQVLRVLTLTRLIDVFPLHATVDEAAGRSRHMAAVPLPPRPPSLASWPRAAIRSAAQALAAERRPPGKQAEAAEVLPRCGLSSVCSSPGRGLGVPACGYRIRLLIVLPDRRRRASRAVLTSPARS